MKAHSISFETMNGFMAMKVIEMVEKALRTKAKQKKSCQKWTAFKTVIPRERLELLNWTND